MLTRTFTALAVVPLLLACRPLAPQAPNAELAPLPLAEAAARCTALSQTSLERLRITTADWVGAGQVRAREPQGNREVGDTLPAHCLLRGRLDERIGVDQEPYHTGFELRLPAAGNGRLLYQGGGGNDGVLNMAVGRNTGALGWADNGLQRGFAAVSSDAGHQSPAPTFGLDPQAREEHAWRAHWRTATTARGGRAPDGTVAALVDDDGWLETGDLGRWTADGRLAVEGRSDDLIVTGGENVWPGPVEDALRSHPLVADAVVVGAPDPEWGQRVVAVVVPQASGAAPTLDALRAHVKDRLPAAAAPRELRLVASIPRTALGKAVRR